MKKLTVETTFSCHVRGSAAIYTSFEVNKYLV